MDTQEIMTSQEVAAYLKITPLTVYRMAQQGKLPGFKVGSDWRFKRSLVDRWIGGQAQPSSVVLVVDDEVAIRNLLTRVLEREGHHVVTAGSGEEAVGKVAELRPDVALVDLKMPGMDGAALIAALRERLPALPAIIMTGYPQSDLISKALTTGPCAVLAKPLNFAQVATLVHQLAWGQRGAS